MIPVMKVAFKITCTRKTVTDDKGQVASPSLDCKGSVKSGVIINLQSGGPSSLFIFEATFVLSTHERMSDCRLSVPDPGERPGTPPFLIFRPNRGTKGRKCFFFFWRPALLLVSGSESRTSYGIISIKFSSTRLKLFISMYKSLTVKRIKCKLMKLSHFKYPSAWWDILYFLLLYFFYLVQANPVNSDIEGPWKVAM